MNHCPREEILALYAAGGEDDADLRDVRDHLEGCARCRELVARERANMAWLENIVGRLGEETLTVAHAEGPAPGTAAPPDAHVPSLQAVEIAGYQIVRELGGGGQAVIYQALQESTGQRVAIKVPREGRYITKAERRRFEREIELVAQLKHPNIISIFDSGLTRDGRKFYVMDYVRGEPLHQYVHDRRLALEPTLELFAAVCEAVQFAHQRGVIHRDLKPSNILVDAEGNPKILDFGLARWALEPAHTAVSVSHELLGTLPYMSPEQARGHPDEVDTRTDVYALGVILYELLTGKYPYPVTGSVVDVLRTIAEIEPSPPSRQWTPQSGVSGTRSRKSGRCPIDDELHTIVLKALAKDRDRRYQTARELARDVRHYLAGEPIEAKGDSLVYVLWKQSRRYFRQAPVAALVLVCAVLTPGLILSLIFWRQAVRERDAAEAVVSFLNGDVFQALNPERVGRGVDLRALLDRAARGIDRRFANAPLAEASIRQTMGNLYSSLGDDDKALVHLEEALQLRQSELGHRHLAVAETLVSLARVQESRAKSVEAEHLFWDALAIRSGLLGETDPLVTRTLEEFAAFARRLGNLELAVQLDARARHSRPVAVEPPTDEEAARTRLRKAQQTYGDHHPEVAARLGELAHVLALQTRYAEAEPLLTRALAIWNDQLGPDHPKVREVFKELEQLCERWGEPERVDPLLTERLEHVLAGSENARLLSTAAWDVIKSPRHPPEMYVRAFEAAQRAARLAPEDGAYLNTLGVAQYRLGRYAEALATLQRSDILNNGHPADVAFLTMSYWRVGQPSAAQRELRRLRDMLKEEPWVQDPQSVRFLHEAEALVAGQSPTP